MTTTAFMDFISTISLSSLGANFLNTAKCNYLSLLRFGVLTTWKSYMEAPKGAAVASIAKEIHPMISEDAVCAGEN